MKKIKHIISTIWIAGLLLVSLTGCDEYYERVEDVFNAVKTVFTGTTADSEETATEESVSEEVASGETTSEESKAFPEYTLSEEDIATFETQLLLCREMLKNGATYAEIEPELDILDELTSDIQNQASIAEVLYYCNMKDEEAVDNYLFSSEVSAEISSDYLSFFVDLYDSGEYEEYFADCLDIELQYLETYSNDTSELTIRNSEILAEFYDLPEKEYDEKLGSLYSEFVTNCNEIATKNGYPSYYEYISTFGYMRDYGSEEREQFRAYVKEYIVPIYNLAYAQYEEAYKDLSREERKIVNAVFDQAYDSLETNYVNAYFETLPEASKTGMQHMFEEETYIITDHKDAFEGAFTIDIEVPYCYFGPGYQDSFTMIHEIGHYYADLNNDTSWISFDLCEVHSQGNEMLFLNYLGTVVDSRVFEALEAYQLYYFIETIVMATIMDDFEERIYHLSSQVDYTTEEFNEIMQQTIGEYGIGEEDEYTRAYMEILWQNVAIGSPVYYISYATSAMASLSLYSQSLEDHEGALEAYRIIQEEVDQEKSFMGTLEKAGIASVFEEEAYTKLVQYMVNN